jgi:hypothetical protein
LAFTPAVGHSSTQHSQVHSVHVHVPVSQQLQQSHFGQPTVWLPSMAGTRPSAACATTAAQAAKTHPKELLVRTTGRTPRPISTGTAAGWFANRHPPTIVLSFPGDGWGDNCLAAISQ